MTEKILDQPEEVSQAAKEARKALISKMVAKHVPLNNTDQAIEMFNTLIQSFVKIDSMDYVQELFEQMMANDLPPNRLTYNLLARGYSRHSPPLIEPLQRLMNMMVEDGGLDVFTFNALILSYAKLGRSCNPHEMFPLMRSHNVTEDISTCNLLFSTYSRVKDERSLELTETLLEWMRNSGIQPNSATYTSIIECCKDNHSRAMDFYEASLAAADAGEIPSEASEERLTAMLKVFGDSKQLQLALNFLEIFLAKYPSFQLSPANHGALFYLYTRCLHIKTAFDNLETYLNSLQEEGVSGQLCNIVISALRTLPEAALAENETNLNEWEVKLKEYPSRTLEDADAAEFKISLLHWRQTYTPSTPSTKAESSKGK
jgi:pentatricopeptide repeat protein